MRAKFINEKFEEESDPIKDMGIGMNHYIYNIITTDTNCHFSINTEKLINLIRKHNKGISKNEVDRFFSFDMSEIYDEIDNSYFNNDDLDVLDVIIEHKINDHSQGWMGMHSDNAMRRGMR